MSERTGEVRRWLAKLRDQRAALLSEVSSARKGGAYSEISQIERVRELRRQYSEEARRTAEVAWKAAREAEAECRSDLQRARAVQVVDKDQSRRQSLSAEITALVSGAEQSGKSGKSRLEVVSSLRRKYQRQGDIEALRVLRLVALPFVDRVRPGTADWKLASTLREQFRKDEAAEAQSAVRLLEMELAELRQLISEVRSEILAAESTATGVHGDSRVMNTGGTPWAIEIMGEVPDAAADNALRLRARFSTVPARPRSGVAPADQPT